MLPLGDERIGEGDEDVGTFSVPRPGLGGRFATNPFLVEQRVVASSESASWFFGLPIAEDGEEAINIATKKA